MGFGKLGRVGFKMPTGSSVFRLKPYVSVAVVSQTWEEIDNSPKFRSMQDFVVEGLRDKATTKVSMDVLEPALLFGAGLG